MQQALNFLAAGDISSEQARLIPDDVLAHIRRDTVFAQLLERVASTDPHGGRAGDAPRAHNLTRKHYKTRRLSSPERAITSSVNTNKVRCYNKGIFPELGTITAQEVWECRLPARRRGAAATRAACRSRAGASPRHGRACTRFTLGSSALVQAHRNSTTNNAVRYCCWSK
jgi:hypothetical protein